jgi:pyrroloquinoline quinone biosynthesis protein B
LGGVPLALDFIPRPISSHMQLRILGSAAGGGFPQWNCSCPNCLRLREGSFSGVARTQTQLAWSGAPGQWTLVNASPDLRQQIESTPELWPAGDGRHSPITDVILTGAEVDQVLGLLLLREFHSFRIHATAAVSGILTKDNSLFGVLARFPGQTQWMSIPLDKPFSAGGARVEALPVGGSFPGFVGKVRVAESRSAESAIGLLVTPGAGGGTLAFLPGVGSVSDALMERLENCNAVLFDGTFWSDEEPAHIPGLGRSAAQMGHMPVSGSGGSLERLSKLRQPRRIYIHINNTNPILDEESIEHRIVRESGWEVAKDGMEITL